MKGFHKLALVGALALMSSQAPAAVVDLFEYAFNFNGTVTHGASPGGVNVEIFDTSTGPGLIEFLSSAPATLALLGLGLMGLWQMRRLNAR